MPATLYGIVLSPNVARTLVVAKFLGVPLTLKNVDLQNGEHKKEPLISLNPFGAIPIYVSEDGKLTLFESRAIAKYLDLVAGGKLQRISDPAAFGLVEVWSSVETTTWSKSAQTLLFELLVQPVFRKTPPDQAKVDAAKAEFSKALEVYEKHLATTKTHFLTSNEVSIADLFHLPIIAPLLAKSLPDIFTPYPHVKEWYDRLVNLPAWQEVAKEQADLFNAFKAAAAQQEAKH